MFTPYKKAVKQRAQLGEFCSLQSVVFLLSLPFDSSTLVDTLGLTDMSIDVSTFAYHALSVILILEIQRALSALLEKYGGQRRL